MFWLKQTEKGREIQLYHIRGTVLERGGTYRWGEHHPFGWDNLHRVAEVLARIFREAGWMGWEADSGNTYITDVKEKFGQLRICGSVDNEDMKEYLNILEELIFLFPGIQDYLSPNVAEEVTVVILDGDDSEETREYTEMLEQMSDNALLKMGE